MDLEQLLAQIVELDASDLYLKSDSIPMARVQGKLHPLGKQKVTPETIDKITESLLDDKKLQSFLDRKEFNFAYSNKKGKRFRVNVYFQRGLVGLVFRRVKLQIPTIEELTLPLALKGLALQPRGLVIVTGATGTGKSTTLASMLNYRNESLPGHIITIEDPIEYLFEDQASIVSQREVGLDTLSFDNALKNALRQAPDVISIGEIRDLETAVTALIMAETGHLVLATLHATNTYQSMERLISLFTADREKQLLLVLSTNLLAILSQRLIPKKDESGRIVATELLVATPRVRELIRENNISEIKDVIRRGEEEGLHSFDQSIYKLFEQGIISEQSAISFADSESEMKMKMKGFKGALKQV